MELNISHLQNKIDTVVRAFIDNVDDIKFSIIESGHINATYKVVIEKCGRTNSYLLQQLNTGVFTQPNQVMDNIYRCARFLKSGNLQYPYQIMMPINTLSQSGFLYKVEDEHWRMFNFIENTTALDRITTSQQAYVIGKAFGSFLYYINQDDVSQYHTTIPDFHNFTKRYMSFRQKIESQWKNSLTLEEQSMVDYIASIADDFIALERKQFPIRLVHHDTKANNVLLEKVSQQPACIIDLDTLMPGLIFSDFGDLMRTVLNPYEEDAFLDPETTIDKEIFSMLLKGFMESVNEMITDDEKTYLIFGSKKIILLQVVRFLEDHLNNDTYYQVEYRGHNLIRAKSQLNLYKSLENSDLSIAN
ncbi:phosphotransferase [Membranihabitans marinus]|uniref:phosphotransferase n=1 Tax=Membranihabitans marinus TaxID=1227546 RepID=UPI001F23F801|nr:phosphotransferase [Membranihabitans marinus]